MSGFDDIQSRAQSRKGGARALKALLPKVATNKQLIELGDDRYLAMMTKSINQAGFSWKVIENKWPSFEEAFLGFDPRKLSYLSPEQWEAFTSDKRVVGRRSKRYRTMFSSYRMSLGAAAVSVNLLRNGPWRTK